MKTTIIMPTDEAIKDLWNIREKCKLNLTNETYQEFYIRVKKPIEILS